MTDPTSLTLTELARAYRTGDLRPGAVTEYYLNKLEPGPVYRLVTHPLTSHPLALLLQGV